MKRFFILLLGFQLFSTVVVSRPDIITIKAGSNILSGNRLGLEWLHRIDQGVYAYSPVYYVSFQNQINVPRTFQSSSNFSMQTYETEGFRLTLNGDALKRAHLFFPFNDKRTMNYTFELVGNIIERDSSSDYNYSDNSNSDNGNNFN